MALIPIDNPCPLIGYYLRVASFIPCLGFLTGLPAIVLGIIGMVKINKNPEVSGRAHSFMAIAFGLCGPILWAIVGVIAANSVPH